MTIAVGEFFMKLPARLKSLWKIFAAIASVVVVTTCAVLGYWTTGCLLAFVALPGVVYDVFTVRDRAWRRALLVAYLVLFSSVVWVFAGLFFERGLFDGHDVRVKDFQDAVYFSVITWTTVGYGDIRPDPSVRLWAAAEAIYGYVYMALLIAQVVQLLVDAATMQEAPSVARGDDRQ